MDQTKLVQDAVLHSVKKPHFTAPTRTSGAGPALSVRDLERGSRELIENARALHPDVPAKNLLLFILELADEAFLIELNGMLRAQHFLREIRKFEAEGRRAKRESEWFSDEIRAAVLLFPAKIRIGKRLVPRSKLEYKDLPALLKALNKQDREEHRNNARIKAVKTLMRLWPRSQKAKRMTLLEVDSHKAGVHEPQA